MILSRYTSGRPPSPVGRDQQHLAEFRSNRLLIPSLQILPELCYWFLVVPTILKVKHSSSDPISLSKSNPPRASIIPIPELPRTCPPSFQQTIICIFETIFFSSYLTILKRQLVIASYFPFQLVSEPNLLCLISAGYFNIRY